MLSKFVMPKLTKPLGPFVQTICNLSRGTQKGCHNEDYFRIESYRVLKLSTASQKTHLLAMTQMTRGNY